MSYWPFITVFISLVLILLFRRLDKRRINFNKFKRYSEKLMADFEQYLKTKSAALGGKLVDLDTAVQRASLLLEKTEEAGSVLKERSIGIEQERGKLQALKAELDRLGSMKAELEEEVKSLKSSLPSLKKLKDRIQRIGLDAARQEKVLQNVSSLIPSFEARVDDRTQKAIEDVKEAVVEEAKGLFSPLIEDYRSSLESVKKSHGDELDHFKLASADIIRETGGRVDELIRLIDDLGYRMDRFEEGRVLPIEERMGALAESLEAARQRIEAVEEETTSKFLARAKEEYEGYAGTLEEYGAGLTKNLHGEVEERSKDLSAYITRLEGRVEGLLADIKKETEKYGEVLELKAKAHESESDVLKSKILAEINEEANKNLLLIKPVVSEMNEKLVNYKREFSSILEEVKGELDGRKKTIDDEIAGFKQEVSTHEKTLFGTLDAQMGELDSKLHSLAEQLSRSIDAATKDASGEFSRRLSEYEQRVVTLEGSIGNLRDIARTGQRMIEERIEKVFSDYRPEIEMKIKSLKETTEGVIESQKKLVVGQIEEIVHRADEELSSREREIAALFERVNERVTESEARLEEQGTALMESVGDIRLEAREELVRELQNLKDLFREEGSRQLERYRSDLEKLGEEIGGLSVRTEEIHGAIDRKIEESLQSVEKNVREIEKSYLKTGEEIERQAKSGLVDVTGEIEEIRRTVRGLKDGMIGEVNGSLGGFREEVEKRFAEHRRTVGDRESEILRGMEEIAERTKTSMDQSRREAEDLIAGFEREAREVQDRVERRTQELEKRIAVFEKESSSIKRAVRYREKVEEDVEKLIDLASQVKEDKKEIMSLKKVIQTLKRDEGDISARVRQLKSEKKAVSDIARNAEQAIGMITVVEEKLGLISSQKDILERMEEGMTQIAGRFESLEKKADALGKRENDLTVSIETVTKMKELLGSLEQRTDLLKESFKEIKDIEGDIKKRVESMNEKTRSLVGNEKRVDEVLSRFREMDSLVADIEARTNQLQTTRQWLARTESRLTNLAENAERLAGELSHVAPEAGGAAAKGTRGAAAGGILSKEAQNKVKTVLTLFEQKWTIPEICKVTKMSRGEVELILELNKR
jgi:chromosome segregation ATPase